LYYETMKGLSYEVRQKLNVHKTDPLVQADRISEVTPAAISLLLVHLKKHQLRQKDTEDLGADSELVGLQTGSEPVESAVFKKVGPEEDSPEDNDRTNKEATGAKP